MAPDRMSTIDGVEVFSTELPDVLALEPVVHRDDRGHFLEMFRESFIEGLPGVEGRFVQDNLSFSRKGVLRGLHYQLSPREQGKVVSAVSGSVFDVAVDIRRSSPTYGQWLGRILSADNATQLWVPPGFAHGFLTLSDCAVVFYKVTDYFSADHDRSIRWDDPDIGIEWPLEDDPILSDKDASAPLLAEAEVFA